MSVPETGGRFPFNLTAAQKVLFFGAFVFLLALRWNSFTSPLERDEGEYAYSAWLMNQQIMPYENAFLQKPPLIVYVYMAGQYFSPTSVVPPRVLSALFLCLSLLLAGAVTARNSGNPAALSAMWFMAAMLTLRILTPFSANTEVFMLLPLLAILLMYTSGRGGSSGAAWFFAGACSATALLFKPIAVVVIAWIYGSWVADAKKSGKTGPAILARLGLSALGSILCSAAVLAPFIVHDAGRSLLECVGTYNFFYVESNRFSLEAVSSFVGELFIHWWFLFVLAGLLLLTRPARWVFHAGLLLLSLISVYRATSGHYYILCVPFLAIASSVSWHALAAEIGKRLPRAATTIGVSVPALVVAGLLLPHRGQILKSPTEITSWFYAPGNPFIEARAAAEKVAALSGPGDHVFIAGSEPEILYYAQRRSPTRFVIMYPLMFDTPYALEYQEEAVRSLQENPPEVVVLSPSRLSWLEQEESPRVLKEYLLGLLRMRYRIAGGITREDRVWHDLVDKELFRKCSLVVYTRSAVPE